MRNQLNISQGNRTSLTRNILFTGAAGMLIMAGLFMVQTASITEISGIINDYTKVVSISNDSVTVQDASNFSVNDKVFIIQMKGAIISESDDATYGDVTSWESAGVYEFNYVKAVSGNTLVFNHTPCKTYQTDHAVQLIRVPEYDSVKVAGKLKAQAWNGTTGGVLILSATHRIRLDADLTVKGMGFTGGAFNGSATGRSLTYTCDVSSGMGGRKGEGIVELTINGCRGKLANGGGGGNDHNGGGGGGGNYGSGGTGGHGWKSNTSGNLSDEDKGGLGGLALDNLYNDGVPRLFMGGGGGGGHQNNGASYPGGDGGGIVLVMAPELYMESTVTINANGNNAQDITINDGSSGGGAGGSILLDVDTYVNPSGLKLRVKGGTGADITTADQHGPGGGGGGGLINTTSTLPADVNTNVNGGVAGIFYSTRSSHVYDGTTHGAVAGNPGAILSNLVIQKCSNPPEIDLNGPSSSGTDLNTTFYPSGPAQAILGNDVAISDQDDTEMSSASVELINPVNGSDEALSMSSDFDSGSTGITATVASDGHSISFQGIASNSTYQSTLRKVLYNNTATSLDRQDRIFEVEVNDGGASSNSANVMMAFSENNFPVEWLYFQVASEGQSAKLEWATATETNSHYFDIQRSWDAVDFESVGRVAAAVNSQTVTTYDFLDPGVMQAPHEEVIYRLKQVDIDGKFELSSLVSLNIGSMLPSDAQLKFPNPVSDQLPISISQMGDIQGELSLFGINGQLIRTKRVNGNGSLQVNWNVSGLNEGIYVLSYKSLHHTISKKLVIRR